METLSSRAAARDRFHVVSPHGCPVLTAYGHIGIHVILCMIMKRTALFLEEDQRKKLLALSEKTGAPVAELIRRAIDKYLQERAKELK